MQDLAEADAPQQNERQRDVNGVLSLMSGGEAPDCERRHEPASEQNVGITVATPIADHSGNGKDHCDQFVDDQRHEEERRRLAAAFRQQPPPAAKRVADPGDTGWVGKEPGEAENGGRHSSEQKRGKLVSQRPQPAPDRPVRHG